MIKKIIFLTVLTVTLSVISFFTYKLIKFISNYKYRDINYDDYQYYYDINHMTAILKKLNYTINFKEYPYKKENINIIFLLSGLDDKNIDEWKKWLKKGKRLIVFRDDGKKTIFDHISFFYKDYHKNITIKSKDSLLEGVKNLHVDINSEISIKNKKIFFNKPQNILTYKKSYRNASTLHIAREKVNEGEIIFVSDCSIFSNKSVLKSDNYIFLNNLFKDYYNEPIIFDYVRKQSYFYSSEKNDYFLFTGNFRFILIQIILLIIFFFLTFIKRYGLSLDKEKFERRSLLKHLEAVGNYFEKSKNPLVFTKILDRYFINRLQNIIKIRSSSENNIIYEAKRRFSISKSEEEIFSMNKTSKISNTEIKREKFIRKLKGV